MNCCYECEDRHVGCHGTCEKYKKYKIQNEINRKKKYSMFIKRKAGYYHK